MLNDYDFDITELPLVKVPIWSLKTEDPFLIGIYFSATLYPISKFIQHQKRSSVKTYSGK